MSVRTTRIAAGSDTSTSVRKVWGTPGPGAMSLAATATSTGSGSSHQPPVERTSSREPRRSSSCPKPCSSGSIPTTAGPGPLASIARSSLPATAKIVAPSVLARSGSSTPGSWTFVPLGSGATGSAAPSSAPLSAPGAGSA